MTRLFDWLADPYGLTPHGFCLFWEPWLIWTHSFSDVAIGLSYFSIPLVLIRLARQREDLLFRPVFWMFAAFILLCGTGHWFDVLTLWVPAYSAQALVKAATAAASVATAAALWFLLPRMLAFPSPDQMRIANEALRESEQRMDRAQAIAGIGSWEFDVQSGERVWSKEMHRIRGIHRDEDAPTVEGLAEFTHPDDCARLYGWLDTLKQGATEEPIEYRIMRSDGQPRVVRADGRPVRDAEGAIKRIAGTLQDITDRRRIEQQLDVALNNLSVGVCFFDADLRLVLANRRYAEIYGLSAEDIRPGVTFRAIADRRLELGAFPNMGRDDYLSWRAALADQLNDSIVELKNGRVISIHQRPMPGGGWISTHEDVTERHKAEQRLSYMARHDALTGLPNRVVFREFLDHALARRARDDSLAVLCLDLDQFKHVNDTLGHAAGDALLCAVATRLTHHVRREDILVRLGGDEFAVLQVGVDQPNQAATLAARLIEVLGEPFELGDQRVDIGTSIGIAYGLAHEADTETLLKNADMALYRAKAKGRGTFCFFDALMDAEAQARYAMGVGLRKALADGEFELYFQPILNAHTEVLTRFEALIRWRHPQHGLIGPSEFIPLAEEIGLIVPIGEWVLQEACREAAGWPENISVAANISAVQLRSPNLVEAVFSALRATGLPASRLELEVTETVLLQDSAATLEPLRRLQAAGVHIALDDFGTGYSSISSLRVFPFDKIKIDQCFVRDLDRRADSVAIIHAIVDLSTALGMSVTAEGVETVEHLRMLRAESCREVQGHLFSPAVPAMEVSHLINRMSVVRSLGSEAGHRQVA
jgi:diguanylate cyclase (GGDEF)-like protein/PAS domain S-box-containing protein